MLANIGRLNLSGKHSPDCQTVAKIQEKQVAKLWNNDHYKIIGIRRFRKSVANTDRWPSSQGVL